MRPKGFGPAEACANGSEPLSGMFNLIKIALTLGEQYVVSIVEQLNKTKVHSSMPASNLCPYCSHSMIVSRLSCQACGISVDAAFPTPRLANLPIEHQRFIEIFVLAGGNLKQIAEQAGVSYPTVRSRLDKVIESLRQVISETQELRGTILDAIGKDKGTPDEAARIIKSV
jgi:hypothetical protein